MGPIRYTNGILGRLPSSHWLSTGDAIMSNLAFKMSRLNSSVWQLMPTSVTGCVCVYICPVFTFIWKQVTLKYSLRLWHLTKTILPLPCWFAVTCRSSGIGFALLSLVFLRLGMTQSVSKEDAPLSVSVPLRGPLISLLVSLLILTSGLLKLFGYSFYMLSITIECALRVCERCCVFNTSILMESLSVSKLTLHRKLWIAFGYLAQRSGSL